MSIFLRELKRFFLNYLSLLDKRVCFRQTFNWRFTELWWKVFGWIIFVLTEKCYSTYFCLVKNLNIFHDHWHNYVFINFDNRQLASLWIIFVLFDHLFVFLRRLKSCSMMFYRYIRMLKVLLLFINTLIPFVWAMNAGIHKFLPCCPHFIPWDIVRVTKIIYKPRFLVIKLVNIRNKIKQSRYTNILRQITTLLYWFSTINWFIKVFCLLAKVRDIIAVL